MKKTIFLVCGRTATGKSSIVHKVCDETGLSYVKSYTTRLMRDSEKEESDHLFISPEDVDLYKDKMAAYTKIGDYEYFTTFDVLDKADFYVIDPKGIAELRMRCKGRYNIKVIYIRVPKDQLLKRARKRGDDAKRAANRISAEDEEFTEFEKFEGWDYHILNTGTFQDAVEKMKRILRKEGVLS